MPLLPVRCHRADMAARSRSALTAQWSEIPAPFERPSGRFAVAEAAVAAEEGVEGDDPCVQWRISLSIRIPIGEPDRRHRWRLVDGPGVFSELGQQLGHAAAQSVGIDR